MKNRNRWFGCIVWIAILCVACDDMEDQLRETPVPVYHENTTIFVLSEGLFHMNNSSLAKVDFGNRQASMEYFRLINKRRLGDTGNDMGIYGSKLYVVVNISSQLEVLDVQTGTSLKQIPFFNEKGKAREPRFVEFHDGKAYVCSFDGTLAKIDTASLEVEAMLAFGNNPDGLCIAQNKLYVSNSGGLNYPSYDSTVSVIDIPSFQEIKRIPVGINPSVIHADNAENLYVVTRGNYGSEGTSMVKIDAAADTVLRRFDDVKALNFTIQNDTAYMYQYDYQTMDVNIQVFDCKTGQIITPHFITDGTTIHTPYGIDVNPSNGDVFITEAHSYVVWGDVLCFDRTGKLKFRLEKIGLNPKKVVFYTH